MVIKVRKFNPQISQVTRITLITCSFYANPWEIYTLLLKTKCLFYPFSQAKINGALMVHEAIFIDLGYFLSFIHQSF